MIQIDHPGSGSCFLPIPDLGVKKAPTPGFGSATLQIYAKKKMGEILFLISNAILILLPGYPEGCAGCV